MPTEGAVNDTVPIEGAAALAAAARLNAQGIRDKAAADYDAAEPRYRRALALVQEAAPDDRDAVATIHHNLAGLDHARGEHRRGETAARHGIEVRLRGRADAAAVAADLIALAALVQGQRRFEESERLYLAGLELLRLVPSPDHFEIAVALGGLGVQYSLCGRHREAIRLLKRSVALKAAVLPPGHPSLELALRNLAGAHRRMRTPEPPADDRGG